MNLLKLAHGQHKSPEEQRPHLKKGQHIEGCAMELVSYIAGERWSDCPTCTSPFLATLVQRMNDHFGDADRARLTSYLPRLVGTRDNDLEPIRILDAADYVLRVIEPEKRRRRDRFEEATIFEQLAPMTDADVAGQNWLAIARKLGPTCLPVQLLAAVYTKRWGGVAGHVSRSMFGAGKSFDLLDRMIAIGPGGNVPDDWFNRGAKLVGTIDVEELVPA